MRHLQRCTTSRRNVRYSTHAFVDESICESGFSSFFCALSACNSLAYTSDKIDSMSMDRRPSTLCRADAATFIFFSLPKRMAKRQSQTCVFLGFPIWCSPNAHSMLESRQNQIIQASPSNVQLPNFGRRQNKIQIKKKLDRPLTRKVSCTRFHGHSDGLFQT